MSMGMMMLPPTIVSLPFKLLLFVLVDGWALITTALVGSYGGRVSHERRRRHPDRGPDDDGRGAKVAAPVLLTALLVGFLISLFQAATQIQEPTLSFVPKMIAVAIALLVTGNWVLSELVSFTQSLFDQLPRAARPDLRPWTSRSRRSRWRHSCSGRRGPPASCCWPRRSTRTVDPRRRSRPRFALALSVLLSTQIAPALPEPTAGFLAVAAVTEVVIGAALGFVVQVLFTAVQMAGDLIDVTGGFSLQPAYDPLAMTQNASIGRLHYLLRHHPAVHQRRAPADRQGLRDVLRRPARGRERAHRPDRGGADDGVLDDVPRRPADRRPDGGGPAPRRRRAGAAEPGGARR